MVYNAGKPALKVYGQQVPMIMKAYIQNTYRDTIYLLITTTVYCLLYGPTDIDYLAETIIVNRKIDVVVVVELIS